MGPARGEADNAGDGFLFGGKRHGRGAPFAGRVGSDPRGVAHFAFVSFGWLTTIVRSASHSPTQTRRYELPNDVAPPSSPSLLLPANHLFFAAIWTRRPSWAAQPHAAPNCAPTLTPA